MFLPLPALDDLRWGDLVDEARSLIPLYAPEWTDHNVSDPGITFAELFAWLAEMEIFQLDQVPARHRRKFLALVGITPRPPRPARTVLRFEVPRDTKSVTVPASLVCRAPGAGGDVDFRTLDAVTVVDSRLVSIEVTHEDGSRHDVTERWRRGETFPVFGPSPGPGTVVVLGFDRPFPAGVPVQLAVTTDALDSRSERCRLLAETGARRDACRPPRSLTDCDWVPTGGAARDPDADRAHDDADGPRCRPLDHHSVRLAWEFLAPSGRWRRLDPESQEVVDSTRALTLDGTVVVTLPAEMAVRPASTGPRAYLRCRIAGGRYDAPPVVRDVALNGVEAEQSVPSGVAAWPIRPDASIVGSPTPGVVGPVSLRLAGGQVAHADFADPAGQRSLVLDFRPPPAADAMLALEASMLGEGNGRPSQERHLPDAPVDRAGIRIASVSAAPPGDDVGPTWRTWALRPDFDASRGADGHAVLDPVAGTVMFGDGEHGMALPAGEPVVAWYRSTVGAGGNVGAGAITVIAANPHNGALHSRYGASTAPVINPVPATGGAAAERLEDAEARAIELLTMANRAVTLTDYEDLALRTPGVRLARVAARANFHPGFPCVHATGVVTLIVLPHLPLGRPMPTRGLMRLVAAHIEPVRLIGTRVIVTGPTYTEVSVRARVRARGGTRRPTVELLVRQTLDHFLDPLVGGPDGTGWPFGRDVVVSELLHVIGTVPGVDHVSALELLANGTSGCGNVCIGAIGLVVAGPHQVEVE